MSARRECCTYCMWYGPVNQDGGMRKHRPATCDDKWGRPNKVQDMTAEPCPGSNKPFATFGCDTEPTTEQEASPVTETPDLRVLANRKTADPETVAEIHANRCPECKGAGCPQCGYKGTQCGCRHHAVADGRGTHAETLPVPTCQSGTTYGVWAESAGGFIFVVDCAMDAANYAAEQLNEEPDEELSVMAVCREHEEQPADSCEDCHAEVSA